MEAHVLSEELAGYNLICGFNLDRLAIRSSSSRPRTRKQAPELKDRDQQFFFANSADDVKSFLVAAA